MKEYGQNILQVYGP